MKFRYEDKYKDYVLIGTEYNNYGNAVLDGAGNVSTNFISGKRISNINGIKTTNVDKKLKSISVLNDDSVYELLTE